MNKVVQILMERDGLTINEAKNLVDEARGEILFYPDEAEEIMMDMLGLEMDYIDDVLWPPQA